MTDVDMPTGGTDIPRADRMDRVQIMGSPDQNWSLSFTQETVVTFLRARMATLEASEPETAFGETTIDLSYSFAPGAPIAESFGSIRLEPAGGLSFDSLSYGTTYDLLEHILRVHPENQNIVVIFGEFRALFHRAGMPRNEGIFRLQNAMHLELSKLLNPD